MANLTIEINDSLLEILKKCSKAQDIPVEELARTFIHSHVALRVLGSREDRETVIRIMEPLLKGGSHDTP